MFIDTHCHLTKEYYDNIDDIVKDNINAGVEKIIISGCNLADLEETITYINHYDNIYATIGFHPEEADIITKENLEYLELLIKNNKKIVGIGEIGLDYHYGKENKDKQIKLFEYQLALAEKLNLPIVVHTRDATKDTIDILKKYHLKGDIHCFSGSLETAKIYISMGYRLGIGGVVTFKNSNLYKVISDISLDDILLETDSPYLTPEPYRGKTNSSKYIPLIASKIADIKNISLEEVSKVTIKNTYDLFDLTD